MNHPTCLTCQHGKLVDQAEEGELPRLRNYCLKHKIWWQELCSDFEESDDLIDIPGRGDGANHA